MIDIKTQYAGLTLRNPIIVGSSGLTNKAERNRDFEKAGAGAIALESLFEEQIEMQSEALMQDSDYPEAADYIRSYVKANQVNDYLELIKKSKELCTIPIIASINCYKADAWIGFARQTELAEADALELNVFFMGTELTENFESIRDAYVSIIRKVKETVSIPVVMKIGKNCSNIPSLVNLLKVNGADGVVLFNRFYQPGIDTNSMQIVSGNVFNDHSDLSDTIRWTVIVSGKIPGISIASSTGVHDWGDVVKCLLAGASAVQMCSAVYTRGTEIISQVLTYVEEWMHQTHYQSLSQFRGKLNYANIPSPTMYERSQFMKYFSNRDQKKRLVAETGRTPFHHRLNSIFELPFSWDETGHTLPLL